MREEFLHFIWKFKLFNLLDLKTSEGEELTLIDVGLPNSNSGPDFSNSKIKIGSTIWGGNIEIHINSSDWLKHKHEIDSAYNTIILHVVYNHDQDIKRQTGEIIPCLELKNRIDNSYFSRYDALMSNQKWIPCSSQIESIDRFIVELFLDRLLAERLERKAKVFYDLLIYTKNDWAETFYIGLSRAFGAKINSDGFELLAKSIPNNVLAKHKNKLNELESLLFGQAGFLETDSSDDNYINTLKKNYKHFKFKYKLVPLDNSIFKFLRLRPQNFPTIRIAQLAGLIHQSNGLFSKLITCETLTEIYHFFNTEVSDYWTFHYTFEKCSTKKNKSLGKNSIDLILINTVIPFLFLYGKQKDKEEYSERALLFLSQIKAEKNSIISNWNTFGIMAKNSGNSQALIELKTNYCDQKKCLNCSIGHSILKGTKMNLPF